MKWLLDWLRPRVEGEPDPDPEPAPADAAPPDDAPAPDDDTHPPEEPADLVRELLAREPKQPAESAPSARTMEPQRIESAPQPTRDAERDAAANHEEFAVVSAGGNRLVQRVRNDAPLDLQATVARHHDGGAPRQRLADGVVGLAPHDHMMSHDERLEVLQVFRDAPRQGVVHTDGAVLRHRHYQR